MALTKSSLAAIPTCYATVSVGTPTHPLDQKFEAIAGAGFQGIELGFPDLLAFASKFHGKDVGNEDFVDLCIAAKEVKALCEHRGLKIVMLQPFANFEGWKLQSMEREDAFRRAKGWIQIMNTVGCDMLQVGCFARGGSSCFANTLHHYSSARQIRLMCLLVRKRWHRIFVSLLTCWPNITSGSRTRTGAGQRMRQAGDMFGAWCKR